RYVPVEPRSNGIFDLILRPTALIDASGLWVNDTGAQPEDVIGFGYINGGAITLRTYTQTKACGLCLPPEGLGDLVPQNVDLTGSIVLSEGSLLDVSSGGRVTVQGSMQLDSSGRAAGKGGSITLQTYVGGFGVGAFRNPPTIADPSS